MSLQTLLQNTPFEEIVPFFCKKDQTKKQLVRYRRAYDSLCSVVPETDEKNEPIRIEFCKEDEHPYLNAENCENDSYEHNAAKEIVIDKDVNIPMAHVAALCLWAQTWFGYSAEEWKNRVRFFGEEADYQMQHEGLTIPVNPKTLEPEGEFDPVALAEFDRWREQRMKELGLA